MTPAFSARRRADEFEALAARARDAEAPVLTRREADRYARLLDVVSGLRALPTAEPRPEFSAALRERLMAEAEEALAPSTATARGDVPAADPMEERLRLPVRHGRRDRRLAVALGGAAALAATGSMAIAAPSALPGDTLYPVKRAMESVVTGLAGDERQQGAALLESASARLVEVDQLARRGTPESVVAVPDTLASFTVQSDQASQLLLESYRETGEEQSITDLRAFTESSMERLLDLEAVVPPDARDELRTAAQQLAAIDDLTRRACPGCPGEGIASIPSVLLSAGVVHDGPVQVPSADEPVVPAAPAAQPTPTGSADQDEIELPDLDDPIDPEGGATGGGAPGGAADGTGAGEDAGSQTVQDPVRELTSVLTGGGGAGSGGGGGTTTSGSTEPVTGVLEGLGQTVDDTTGTLDDTLDDTTGSLLD